MSVLCSISITGDYYYYYYYRLVATTTAVRIPYTPSVTIVKYKVYKNNNLW